MELSMFFLFLIVLVLLIIIYNKTSKQSKDFESFAIKILKQQQKIIADIELLKTRANEKPEPIIHESPFVKPEVVSKPIEIELIVPKEEEKQQGAKPLAKQEEAVSPVASHIGKSDEGRPVPVPAYVPERDKTVPDQVNKGSKAEPPKPKPTFWERNPDLEKFIGENLINKIGIAILVIGIGFFVKFAIDQQWINEYGRVAIGVFCGGVLIALAHRLRESFKAFSAVLIGGGLAVLYITIAIAYQEYRIIPQTGSFLIMVFITCFAVFVSLAYDRQELAVIAFVGGFVSPLMLSNGGGNYIVLFTYVLVLNLGMLGIAYQKGWKILNIVCYGFTILLFGVWLAKVSFDPNPPYVGALVYATIFYVIFFLMNILNNIKEQRKFLIAEYLMLLSNTFLYYSAGMYILLQIDGGSYQGLFTIILAIFNLMFTFGLFRSQKVDKNLLYLLLGLVLTFVSLAAPVQLEGNYITLFWAFESVLLLWLSQKSGIKLMKVASFVVLALMLVSLCMDWGVVYKEIPRHENQLHRLLFNKGLITTLVSMLSVALFIKFLRYDQHQELYYIPLSQVSYYLMAALVLFSYVGLYLEVYYQIEGRIVSYDARVLYKGLFHFSYILGLIFWMMRFSQKWLSLIVVVLASLVSCLYMFYYAPTISLLRDTALKAQGGFLHFNFHYILLFLLFFISWQVRKLVFGVKVFDSKYDVWAYWSFCMLFLFVLSAEVGHLWVIFGFDPLNAHNLVALKQSTYKIVYPILWGICSFGYMYYGLSKKVKVMRIIALVVFGVTLLKLFIFDVANMSEGGKIAAFISLGILLLVISFMYQRLKKIIVDDEQKPKET